ncbi:MAG: hypothetical protein ACUVUD_03350 [bacterium]
MKIKPQKRSSPLPPGRFVSVLPYLLLASAAILFFWQILTRQRFLWEDILYQYYPFNSFLFRKLRQFHLPLWNPYMFAGMPFLADIQTQVFYPLNWFFALIGNSSQNHVFWLVELKCIIHILLGAVGFYRLMRELKLSRYSALIAGLTFGFSGFMVLHIIHLTIVNTFAWFPLILLFFYRTLRDRRLRDAGGTALVLGLSNLAGHPQMTLHHVYTLSLLFILYIAFNWQKERIYLLKTHLPLFFLAILLGFALSACAYLPAYRFSTHTVRETLSYAEATETSLPPWFLITLFIPKFFGSIAGGEIETVPFWGDQAHYTYWETCIYTGIVPLLLASIGIFFSRNKLRWQFFIVAIVALLFALGKFTPLYRLAFNLLPGFNRFRIPARFVDLFTVAVAFIAGLGMEVLIQPSPSKNGRNLPRPRVLIPGLVLLAYGTGIFLLLVSGLLTKILPPLREPSLFANSLNQTRIMFLFLTGGLILIYLVNKSSRYRPLFLALLVALNFLDLYLFGRNYGNGKTSPEDFYPSRPFISSLIKERAHGPFRLNARFGNYMLLQRNEGLLWELELLEGYTPLKLSDYITFDIPVQRRNDLLNVRFQIHIDSTRGTATFVENTTFLPRYWLADSFIVLPDRKRILTQLNDPDFDYRRIVILEAKPDSVIQKPPATTSEFASSGNITVLSRTPERVELEVETSRPTILVFSEIYYPEWKAAVDGKPVKIMRGDYCLRALPLSSGKHRVTSWYDRTNVNAGILLSLIALLLIALTIFSNGKKFQKPNLTKVKNSYNT